VITKCSVQHRKGLGGGKEGTAFGGQVKKTIKNGTFQVAKEGEKSRRKDAEGRGGKSLPGFGAGEAGNGLKGSQRKRLDLRGKVAKKNRTSSLDRKSKESIRKTTKEGAKEGSSASNGCRQQEKRCLCRPDGDI